MQTILDNEFSAGRAMSNFNPILLIFAIALVFNLAYGQEDKGTGEVKFIEETGGSPKFFTRVERYDKEAKEDKHKELEQLREPPPSSLVEDFSEIAKHISKETSTHEEMIMDESLGQERIYNVHLHKPSIPPKRQTTQDGGIVAELDAHSCSQEASTFGHEHEAAVISHELLCEVMKLSQYLALSQANLQKEIKENSQSIITEEYAALAAEEALVNILENSVILAEEEHQTPPPEAPSSVPIASIQASVLRLRDVLTKLTVYFEDVVVKTIGEHPELLEQLRQQLLEVENTLGQLRPDYDNLVNQLAETSKAVYQGFLAAGMLPAVESTNVPAADSANVPAAKSANVPAGKSAPAVNGDHTVTTYSSATSYVDPQQPLNQRSVSETIINGQPVNPFINARLLRRVLRRVARHIIKNLDVQTAPVLPSGEHGQPTYPFINEGFYGSLLKHIIKHLYTVPTSPASPGAEEDTTVEPFVNANFISGILGYPLVRHSYVYHSHGYRPIYPYHPHLYTSLAAESEEPSNPVINENALTSVLKHIIKHFNYVPSGPTENVQPEEPIINENLLGSILRHLAHRFHGYTEGDAPVSESPLSSPPVTHQVPVVPQPQVPVVPQPQIPVVPQPQFPVAPHPVPPVLQAPGPQVIPSYPSPSGTTYSQSSSSSYNAGSSSSSSTLSSVGAPGYPLSPGGTKSQSTSSSYTPGSSSSSSTNTGTVSSPSLKPVPYTVPSHPGISHRLPHVPVSSGSTYSQSSSSSYTAGAASSSSTLTGTSPVSQLPHVNPPQVHSTVPQSETLYALPQVPSYSGSTYSQSSSSSYTPQSASSSNTVTSAGPSGNPLAPQATKSVGSSSSYTPGSASSSSTLTGTSGITNPPVVYPQTYYRGPLGILPPITSNPGTTYSQSTSSSYTPGSASSSQTATGTRPPPQPYTNQGYPNSALYSSQLRGKPVIPPQQPRLPVYPGTYSSSSSSSYTPSSASSSTTTTSASGFPNTHPFFPQTAPVQQTAPVSGNHNSVPQVQPYSSNSNTFSSSSSSSYTPGSASSSSTLTSTSPSRLPSPQPASVNVNHNNLSQLQSTTPSHQGTASATGTSASNVHQSSAATVSKSSSSSHTPESASSSSTLTGSSPSQNLGNNAPVQYNPHSEYSDSQVSASEVVSSSATLVKSQGSSTPGYSPSLLPPPSQQKPVAVASINVNGYETMNLTLVFPQDKVASALGRKTLLPGDVVAIPVKSGTILFGRVVDAVTPITFKLSSTPQFPNIRRDGRLWKLRVRDFQDSYCRNQLNRLLEVINNQA